MASEYEINRFEVIKLLLTTGSSKSIDNLLKDAKKILDFIECKNEGSDKPKDWNCLPEPPYIYQPKNLIGEKIFETSKDIKERKQREVTSRKK